MIEAVVRLEWLLRVRRDRFGPLLTCYFFCLLLDCCALYIRVITRDCIFLPPSPGRTGRLLTDAVEFVWLQQWLWPFLLAPAFVASAFTSEKANGMLPLLFTTPLTSGEIILGKFLGRVFPLTLLGLAHFPFWALLAGLVGVNPLYAGVLAVASLWPILAVSAVSLLASVWCRKSSDAVVASYVVCGIAIVAILGLDATSLTTGPTMLLVLENSLASFGPDYLLEPVWDAGAGLTELCRRTLLATAAWGSVVIGCLGLACWRLRPASMDRPQIRASRLSSRRPAVGDEPIPWKEHYREQRMPLALFRYIPGWLSLITVFVGTACAILWSRWPSGLTCEELLESLRTGNFQALGLGSSAPLSRSALVLVQGLVMLLLAALTVGVRCASAVSGERESRTWESLLLTPLSTRELIHGKVRGVLQSALPYLAVYALAAVPLAWLAGKGELAVTLVTLLLAWPIMSVAGAVGINESARAANSWRSILTTVRLIIVGSFLTAVVSNFILGFLALVVLGLGDFVEILVGYLPLLDWLGVERRYQRAFYFLLALSSLRPALRPRQDRLVRPYDVVGAAPAMSTTKAPTTIHLSGLNHTALALAVYAS